MNLTRKTGNSQQQMRNTAEWPERCQSWLSDYFKRQVLPLERRYIQLIYRQIDLLSHYLLSPDLTPEQKDELSIWISELLRTLYSHAAVEKDQREQLYRKIIPDAGAQFLKAETVAETATREAKSLWYLFGAASQEEAERNIHEFCRSREQQMAQVYMVLTEITSLQVLVQRLQQRQQGEDRTARFLEEAPSYSQSQR